MAITPSNIKTLVANGLVILGMMVGVEVKAQTPPYGTPQLSQPDEVKKWRALCREPETRKDLGYGDKQEDITRCIQENTNKSRPGGDDDRKSCSTSYTTMQTKSSEMRTACGKAGRNLSSGDVSCTVKVARCSDALEEIDSENIGEGDCPDVEAIKAKFAGETNAEELIAACIPIVLDKKENYKKDAEAEEKKLDEQKEKLAELQKKAIENQKDTSEENRNREKNIEDVQNALQKLNTDMEKEIAGKDQEAQRVRTQIQEEIAKLDLKRDEISANLLQLDTKLMKNVTEIDMKCYEKATEIQIAQQGEDTSRMGVKGNFNEVTTANKKRKTRADRYLKTCLSGAARAKLVKTYIKERTDAHEILRKQEIRIVERQKALDEQLAQQLKNVDQTKVESFKTQLQNRQALNQQLSRLSTERIEASTRQAQSGQLLQTRATNANEQIQKTKVRYDVAQACRDKQTTRSSGTATPQENLSTAITAENEFNAAVNNAWTDCRCKEPADTTNTTPNSGGSSTSSFDDGGRCSNILRFKTGLVTAEKNATPPPPASAPASK